MEATHHGALLVDRPSSRQSADGALQWFDVDDGLPLRHSVTPNDGFPIYFAAAHGLEDLLRGHFAVVVFRVADQPQRLPRIGGVVGRMIRGSRRDVFLHWSTFYCAPRRTSNSLVATAVQSLAAALQAIVYLT
jgi:hypothetical protein